MKANETVSLDFLTPERLLDPAAMQWLLQRLSLTRRMGHDSKWKEASDVLSDSALEGWLLSTDERIGARLAEEIHPSRLVPMTDQLVESWPHLADTAAGELIVQLAKIVPGKATELIARFVKNSRKVDANPRTWGVLTAMELLGNRARPQAEVLLRRAASGPIFDVMGMGRLFHAGALLQCAGVIPLLESFLRLRGNREMEAQLALFDTFAGLAPEAPFFEMAVGWIQQRRGTLLRDFPEFFKVNSPLDSLDEVLASRLDDLGPRIDDLIDSLDSGFQQLICQSLVRVGLTESSSHLRRLIRGFVASLAANRCVRSNRPWGGTPYERLVELASIDVAVLPEEKRLIEALVARCTRNCIPALQVGLQDARYSAGLRRLLSVARQVRFGSRLQEVIETLGVDIHEEALEEATFALIEGGKEALSRIEEMWPELDFFQRLQLFDVIEGIGTDTAARTLIRLFPSARGDSSILESWIFAASNLPSPEMRRFLFRHREDHRAGLDAPYRALRELIGGSRRSSNTTKQDSWIH